MCNILRFLRGNSDATWLNVRLQRSLTWVLVYIHPFILPVNCSGLQAQTLLPGTPFLLVYLELLASTLSGGLDCPHWASLKTYWSKIALELCLCVCGFFFYKYFSIFLRDTVAVMKLSAINISTSNICKKHSSGVEDANGFH